MTHDNQVYVRTRGGSWRPVPARKVGEDCWLILEEPGATDVRSWEFNPGDTVRCRPYELTDHDLVLVAYEKAPSGGA